jgi:glycosyltransferase involved in cell wall biosynthesis
MKLGLILSPGDSLEKQNRTGQFNRLLKYYLIPYSQQFEQVLIFSYGDRNHCLKLPQNIRVVPVSRLDRLKSVDVVRVFQAPGGLPGVLAKLLFGKPLVVTYGYDYVKFAQIEGRPLLARLLKLVLGIVLTAADKVLVTDRKNLWIKRSVYLPNGVDPDEFKPGSRKQNYLVLSVGRLTAQKNYLSLIHAISRSQLVKKIKLVIIGEGKEKEKLLALAQKLQVNLSIIKPLPHQQLVRWYQQAAVFVLVSKIEGHPKALLEAMSCGCACLTTDFPGQLIEDGKTGLVGLEKLDKLLINSKLQRILGNQARQAVINRYNIKILIKRELALLKQCLK